MVIISRTHVAMDTERPITDRSKEINNLSYIKRNDTMLIARNLILVTLTFLSTSVEQKKRIFYTRSVFHLTGE